MAHIWIIEAKHIYSKDKFGEWHPMVGNICFGSRTQARKEAKKLYRENKYNWSFKISLGTYIFAPVVKYRATKYKKEGD